MSFNFSPAESQYIYDLLATEVQKPADQIENVFHPICESIEHHNIWP